MRSLVRSALESLSLVLPSVIEEEARSIHSQRATFVNKLATSKETMYLLDTPIVLNSLRRSDSMVVPW